MSAAETQGPRTTAAAVNEIEGYLLWQAEIDRARGRARTFTADIPWLTDSERREVEELYAREQLATAREYLRRVRERRDELRDEYESRYRLLRRRLLTTVLAGGCGILSLLILVLVTVLDGGIGSGV